MSSSYNAEPISIAAIAQVLRRRRLQILVTFFVVTIGVIGGTLAMPKQFGTHMKVLVKNGRADMIVTADRNDRSGVRGEVSETEINSEIELLTSRNLLEDVVRKCALDRRQKGPQGSVAVERAVERLQRDLKVTPVRKSNVILVEYVDKDPHQAAAVLAKLADLYLEQHLKVHGTPGSFAFFQEQAGRYQRELEAMERQIAEFRRQENVVMPGQQKDVALQKSAEAESAVMQAEASIREYSQKIDETRRQLQAVQPRVITQSRTSSNQYSVERLHTMLAELGNRRTQLLAKFRPEDRLVQEADQEIADTQASLEKAQKLKGVDESTDINPVYQSLQIELAREQAELAGAESRRLALTQQLRTYREQLTKFAGASAVFDDLLRTQKAAEENYALYTKKAEESRIAQSLDAQKIANVAIVETPVEPHLPSKPNVWLNLSLGFVLAAFLAIGGAFAAEYFDQSQNGALPDVRMQAPLGAGAARRLIGPVESLADLEDLGLLLLATTYRS